MQNFRYHSQSVSIHALTRSATVAGFQYPYQQMVSIHALTRSATTGFVIYGCDWKVSIHALTRSATNWDKIDRGVGEGFNPRTHEECDSPSYCFGHCNKVSIHALTRSATFMYVIKLVVLKFQSTHSRGVRLYSFDSDELEFIVSIHALTRSATFKKLDMIWI